VEKAYRRVDQLLARESREGRYEPLGLGEGRVLIRYHPEQGVKPDPSFCTVREGMLQALPLAFGLLPARAKEVECVHRGARCCAYEVEWSRSSRTGIAIGGGLGLAVGVGAALFLIVGQNLGFATGLWIGAAAIMLSALCATAGHALDLSRQLQAVAGSRRGQLALLDQADSTLAERMDELAKLDAGADEVPNAAEQGRGSLSGAGRSGSAEPSIGDAVVAQALEGAGLRVAQACSGLQRQLAELQLRVVRREGWTQTRLTELIEGCGEEAQRLEGVGRELEQHGASAERGREPSDLGEIVQRAVEGLRPARTGSQTLKVEIDNEAPEVCCEAFQIEQVATHLVRNALEATATGGRVDVATRATPGGVELVVEDDGPGMDQDTLDEMFDPFIAAPVAGVDTQGIGLPICYRIVNDHGGELLVSTESGRGTRVSVLLPAAGA
jgi:signal transduction histidine kinase